MNSGGGEWKFNPTKKKNGTSVMSESMLCLRSTNLYTKNACHKLLIDSLAISSDPVGKHFLNCKITLPFFHSRK